MIQFFYSIQFHSIDSTPHNQPLFGWMNCLFIGPSLNQYISFLFGTQKWHYLLIRIWCDLNKAVGLQSVDLDPVAGNYCFSRHHRNPVYFHKFRRKDDNRTFKRSTKTSLRWNWWRVGRNSSRSFSNLHRNWRKTELLVGAQSEWKMSGAISGLLRKCVRVD